MGAVMKTLSPEELATLKTIAKRDQDNKPSRSHLEKLSRLDLIEPCPEGMCMTVRGQEVLVKRK